MSGETQYWRGWTAADGEVRPDARQGVREVEMTQYPAPVQYPVMPGPGPTMPPGMVQYPAGTVYRGYGVPGQPQAVIYTGLTTGQHVLYAISGLFTCGLTWMVWPIHWWFAKRQSTVHSVG